MATRVSLKFLGVRTIHSSPSVHNQTTGGNTSCLMLDDGQDTIFINAGFGINIAGDQMFGEFSKKKAPVKCTLLFSDFLWDSTLGLPFFTPIHFKSTSLKILTVASPSEAKAGLDDAASNLFSPFYGTDGFRSHISIEQLTSKRTIGKWTISALSIQHPLASYPIAVWRLSHPSGVDLGAVMLANNDTETLANVARFLSGAKTLICAASSSPNDDRWDLNRTSFQDALSLALASNSRELYLTQFHPEMDDLRLQQKLLGLQEALEQFGATQPEGLMKKKLVINLASEVDEIVLTKSASIKKTG